MAIDWLQLLNSGLQLGSQLLPKQTGTNTSIGGLQIPTNLLGAGLATAGVLGDKEPGEVTQARQFLRNQFTSPNATSDLQKQSVTGAQTALNPLLGNVGPSGPGQEYLTNLFQNPNGLAQNFASNVSAVSQQFQPLLTQQRQRGIDDISQRFAAAFPGSVGAQGPEFGTLSRYITDEALPREQAFLGQLGLDLQGRQQNAAGQVYQDEQGRRALIDNMATRGTNIPLDAAGKILDTSKPDPMAQLLSLLGYDMLTRGQGGQGQGGLLGGLGGTGTQGTQGNAGAGQAGTGGTSGIINQVSEALRTQNFGQLAQLLSSGALAGQPFPFGVEASTQAGQLIQQAINAGLVESPAAEVVGQGAAGAGAGFQGLLGAPGFGSAAGLASGAATVAGSGYVGYQVGKSIGDAIESPGSSATGVKTGAGGAAGGAVAGAAVGAVIGDGPGAVIGAIVGGLAGAFGGSGAERRREDAQTEQEAQITSSQRPEVVSRVQQFSQNSQAFLPSVMNAWQAPGQPVLNALAQAAASGNPQVNAILSEAKSTLGPLANGQFDVNQIGPSVNGMAALMNAIYVLASRGNIVGNGDLKTPAGSETLWGLVQSSETGKFQPGVDEVNKRIRDFNTAQSIFNRLMSL